MTRWVLPETQDNPDTIQPILNLLESLMDDAAEFQEWKTYEILQEEYDVYYNMKLNQEHT